MFLNGKKVKADYKVGIRVDYQSPRTKVLQLQACNSILAGSPGGDGDANNPQPGPWG